MRPATKRRLREAGNTSLAVGGGALALGTAAAFLTPGGAPPWLASAFKVLGYSGAGVIAAGLVCRTWEILGKGATALWDKVWAVEVDHFHRLALRAELDEIYRIGREEIGGELVTPEILRRWFDRNEEIFWVLIEHRVRLRPFRSEYRRTVGYFILIPLTDAALGSVESGDLTAHHFRAEHIAVSGEQPAAIYIGAVCARRGKARTAVMNYFRVEMRGWIRRGTRIFLTRPVSQRGLDLTTAYGFDFIESKPSDKLGALTKRVFREDERL